MRWTAAGLGTVLGLVLSAESCVGIMLNPLDRYGKDFGSPQDWFQPGTGSSLALTSVTALVGLFAALRRSQGESALPPLVLRALGHKSGRRASLIFATYFALFTYWCFAWTEARSPLWLLVWFTPPFGLTMAACWGAVWAASRFNQPLQPASGGQVDGE